jgi:sugar phosphate permease
MTATRDQEAATATDAGGDGAPAADGYAAPPEPPRKRRGIFFGWYIVAGGFVLNAILGGLMFHAFGLYVVQFVDEFGWSRTALSIAFSIQMVEAGLLGPIQGFVLDKFGPRRIMLVGITIFGIGFFMLSQINTLTEFYIAFIVIALGMGVGSMMGVAVAVVNWFNRKRAFATALMAIGFAFGGFLQPGVAWALENLGWRETSVISGLIVLGVGLPLAMLMRHRPEQYGYGVDGDPPRQGLGAGGTAEEFDPDEINFTWQEAMRTRAFWLISIGHALSLLVIGAVMVHFVSYVNDSLGFSLGEAANLLLVITVFTVIGMLLGGYLGDRMPMRHILAVAMIGHMVSLFVLTLWPTLAGALTFSVIHGLSFGARGPLTMAIRAEYFGRAAFGTVMGFSSLIILIGMVFGPIVAGQSYDITGSYQAGFIGLAIVGGLGSLAFVWSTRPAPPPSWRAKQAAGLVPGMAPATAAASPATAASASVPVAASAVESTDPYPAAEPVVAAASAAPARQPARRRRMAWVRWIVAMVVVGSAVTAAFIVGGANLALDIGFAVVVAVNDAFLALVDSYGALPTMLTIAAVVLVLLTCWLVLARVRRRREEDRAWSAPVMVIATGAEAAERIAATEARTPPVAAGVDEARASADPVEAVAPVEDTEPAGAAEPAAAIDGTGPTEDTEPAEPPAVTEVEEPEEVSEAVAPGDVEEPEASEHLAAGEPAPSPRDS